MFSHFWMVSHLFACYTLLAASEKYLTKIKKKWRSTPAPCSQTYDFLATEFGNCFANLFFSWVIPVLHLTTPISQWKLSFFIYLFFFYNSSAAVIVNKLIGNREITRTYCCHCSWDVICLAVNKTVSPKLNNQNDNYFYTVLKVCTNEV